MMLQITNGTIDPSWIIVVLGGVVSFFLIRTLMKIDSRMEKQDARMQEHDERSNLITRVLLQMLTRLGGDDQYYHELSKQLNSEK